ncbi:MAG: hypothetical protein ACEPOV_04020 [Hyphomicrobiales bacterium]
MLYSKRKSIYLSLILMFICGIFMSCEKKETTVKETEVTGIAAIKNMSHKDITKIGKLHNEFVQRAYDKYISVIKSNLSKSDPITIDILDLIDFMVKQPESKGIKKSEIKAIKEFFYNFKTNKSSKASNVDQWVNYLKKNVEIKYGMPYERITRVSAEKEGSNDILAINLSAVAFSVGSNSEEYWRAFHNDNSLRKEGSGTIAADTAGALWGLFFGGVGSIIVGGVASIVANESNNGGKTVVFDGKIHTPKDI